MTRSRMWMPERLEPELRGFELSVETARRARVAWNDTFASLLLGHNTRLGYLKVAELVSLAQFVAVRLELRGEPWAEYVRESWGYIERLPQRDRSLILSLFGRARTPTAMLVALLRAAWEEQ